EKHQGISYLLLPMRQPGVEVRPIQQIDGSSEFNEVYFANARCPRQNVVGGVHNGWKVAMTTLGFERGASSTTGHRRFQKELEAIVDAARTNGRAGDREIRQGLARAWSKVKIMQINGYRALTDALHGTHLATALGATHKMFWSEYHREAMNLFIDIMGMRGQVLSGPASNTDAGADLASPSRRGGTGYPVSDLQASFFFSRSETIWGGTAEIQRNIVGERVLGLPKEPKAATG
ncbi:MAG TPA: acyl-CoA dehydrogenase family protein, partial [Acidimicrobiales bacterium]|nr:acyl-CoA dehydrogenase family protein [Acidimicrobiales bacterium]